MNIFHFSATSTIFLTSWWLSTSRQRLQSHANFFRRKTESTNYTFYSYLKIFESDSKMSRLNQQSENDWTFRLFKNKYICLKMTGNDRLEKVTSFPWIGQNFKACHKRDDRSKFLERLKQTIPTKWDKSRCMMGYNQQNSSPDFFKVWHTIQTFVS